MTVGAELVTLAVRALAVQQAEVPPETELAEALRFTVAPSLAMPVAEAEVDVDGDTVCLQTNIAGLIGATGPLPMPYTALAAAHAEGALPGFLAVVQQPPLLLLLRAHLQRRFWLDTALGEDRLFTRVLHALTGLLDPTTQASTGLPPALFAHYCGLLIQQPSAATLGALLRDTLGVDVEVRQLRGEWVEIESNEGGGRSAGGLGGDQPASLGEDSLLGDRVLLPTGRLDIEIGPLKLTRLHALLPGTPGALELVRLVRLVAGSQQAFSYELHLDPAEAPQPRLWSEGDPPQRLGHTFWVADTQQDSFVAGPFHVAPLTAALAS